MSWFILVLKKSLVFRGRARRTEYWMFTLISSLIYIALLVADEFVGNEVLSIGFTVAILLPALAVTVRRLHDTDRSGWWSLIGVVPCVGTIVMLIFTAAEGTPGQNKYGMNPKESHMFTDATP
ncbi:DUF805 domain-containing protein [Streptomyces aurantiogriseus]|uniref:DUF805 domain-containing protein n=1 Tax=Streptomyces aurantiogriseus TaxID=66870 RepID=A0A918FL77_9ACTN|nr:DUF805 domain-containing protein [Streptomyces aurantiogriseus]GGR49070.1 DUF805 domain-containing protein [Streptomyces aurantiogriseus]